MRCKIPNYDQWLHTAAGDLGRRALFGAVRHEEGEVTSRACEYVKGGSSFSRWFEKDFEQLTFNMLSSIRRAHRRRLYQSHSVPSTDMHSDPSSKPSSPAGEHAPPKNEGFHFSSTKENFSTAASGNASSRIRNQRNSVPWEETRNADCIHALRQEIIRVEYYAPSCLYMCVGRSSVGSVVLMLARSDPSESDKKTLINQRRTERRQERHFCQLYAVLWLGLSQRFWNELKICKFDFV